MKTREAVWHTAVVAIDDSFSLMVMRRKRVLVYRKIKVLPQNRAIKKRKNAEERETKTKNIYKKTKTLLKAWNCDAGWLCRVCPSILVIFPLCGRLGSYEHNSSGGCKTSDKEQDGRRR